MADTKVDIPVGDCDNVAIGGDGKKLYIGTRVYSFDLDGRRVNGVLYRNRDYTRVSEWYIRYDDGIECAVLDMSLVFKIE